MTQQTEIAVPIDHWMYGIEWLTREHSGYIAWRGKIVEHYSFSDPEKEKEAAEGLSARCRRLEENGFPVSWGTATGRTAFDDAPKGSLWVDAIANFYTAFAENGKCKWLVLHISEHHAVAMRIVSGEIVLRYALGDSVDSGAYSIFHALQNEGLSSIVDHLQTYNGFVAAMEEAGITPEAVTRVLAAPLPNMAIKY